MSQQMNEVFNLAADIVSNTSRSVFLTGKAGTGKTTFLHYIRNHTDKNVIVAAPTGVAAINAGGVTLHSLLQLPFEPFIPNFEGKKKLDYHFKLRKSKIEMLRELDLLIIDEVSMLRADMLDAIDYMLRRYRNDQSPFGGVQLLFIGDMFQLPPVVQQSEWELLKHYYPSPFFFHSQVLGDYPLLYIELKTIYRQQDKLFIDILNRIRNNCPTADDLQVLNQRYKPTFVLPEDDRYIVLCTHNYKADRINNEELAKLSARQYLYKGEITGDFSENSLPTEHDLILKEGAQVMFVKNDAGEQRRYYNGKLATVSRLKDDMVEVQFEDGQLMELEKETWSNIRYNLNAESGEIEEDVLGSFVQYPIRLAWAITIHKSQGLTFDRVVIDAGQAFAAGQVYVALSRCTTLEGIVLFSRITPQSISTDKFAIEFSAQEENTDRLRDVLCEEKPAYCARQLKKYFDWTPFIRTLHALNELASEKKIPNQDETQATIALMCSRAIEQQEIARNFLKELERILASPKVDVNYLKERVGKGISYFHHDVQQHILLPVEEHLASLGKASKVKQYLRKAREIHSTLLRLLERLEQIRYGDILLTEGIELKRLIVQKPEQEEILPKDKKQRPEKGETQRLSLSLYNEGKTVREISKERNLKPMTIEGHLAGFVLTGELEATRLMDADRLQSLKDKLESIDINRPLSAIKEDIGDEYSYFEIRVAINYLLYRRSNN